MAVYKFKTKPDAHQLACLKQALKLGRYGIFFQQRVGKTKVAIDFCGAKAISDNIKKVLIVCPLSVRTEWGAQIADHLPCDYDFALYPKSKGQRITLLNKVTTKLTFIVINYDLLTTEKDKLLKWDADIVIFDESHLIKNQASKRSKASHALSKKAKFVLLLTGTPIPKKWYDIFGQFRALDDTIFGARWTDFKKKYAIMGGFMGKEIVGCTDYDAISDITAKHSMRVLRKDVFDEPQIENVTIPIELESFAARLYKNLKKQFIADLTTDQTVTADMAGVRTMRLQQLCGGFIKSDDGEIMQVSSAKLDILKDLVKTKIEGGEQLVIFYRFTAEGSAIEDMLRTLGIHYGSINGSVSEEMRKEGRDAFQAGMLDVMTVQIATGAMGITLDKAHINIFYSMDFSLSNFQQARDRVMGRNQHSDVTNYFLAVDKSVDIKIMKTLQKDEDIASTISDKWRWLFED